MPKTMNSTQIQIIQKLADICTAHDIRIPLAVESGSRAWGFASPDSDYDCRFVYVRPAYDYLSVFDKKDTIDYVPDKVFDLSGWDLKKFITHLVKSNAVMLEWLRSNVVYRKNDTVAGLLWELGRDFFNPIAVSWHYLSMAKNKLAEVQSADTAKIKQYCYILRPLACIRFIHETGEIPFMEYRTNLENITVPAEIREDISALLTQKETAKEGELFTPSPRLFAYLTEEAELAERRLAGMKHEKNQNYDHADAVFRKIIKLVNENGAD